MWEENLGTQAGARLIEGVRLIRGPLNTGFTVVKKSTSRFTKSPSLVLIGLVFTEIQAFHNVKDLQRNVWKCEQIVRICPDFNTFLCKVSDLIWP